MSIKATALDDYELGNIRKDTEIVETNIQQGPDSAEADIEAIEPNLSNSLGTVPAVSIPVEVPGKLNSGLNFDALPLYCS